MNGTLFFLTKHPVSSSRFLTIAMPRFQPYWLGIAAAIVSTTAAAQAESDVLHNGRWVATVHQADGSRETANFVIRDFGGEWTGASGRKASTGSACAGRKLPITVQASTAGALEFTVWGKQVSPRCADLTIETKSTDAKTFEGTVGSDGTVRLSPR